MTRKLKLQKKTIQRLAPCILWERNPIENLHGNLTPDKEVAGRQTAPFGVGMIRQRFEHV